MAKQTFKEYLNNNIVITDGAFGTYYASLFDEKSLPEHANINDPNKVFSIHERYINAGSKLIRTNTYASNTICLSTDLDGVRKNIRSAVEIAKNAAALSNENIFVAADIGPIPHDQSYTTFDNNKEYIEICKTFIKCNTDVILFETFADLEEILPAIEYIKQNSDIFIIVQFAVNQFGYSANGLSVRNLFEQAAQNPYIDAVGLNCGVGCGHMQQILSEVNLDNNKFISALPNAGYPQNISNRMIFGLNNIEYFKDKIVSITDMGVRIVGGCCGTTPEYINSLYKELNKKAPVHPKSCSRTNKSKTKVTDNSFFAGKNPHEKLIAVELAPPLDSDDQKLMEAAHILEKSSVDVVTFPDSPSGRTRADSILMAEKVHKETGLCVMPHLCCRDKNAIAMRSQLLGAHLNGINNFLVITGDPIPSVMRQTVKSVFNFDSVGLMNIINDMNSNQFGESVLSFGGAINQNRLNINLEIERIRKKMKAGASFFLTQPVFDKSGAQKIAMIKKQTGARILCGIMPLVSLKNALFMKNEMTGIEISDEIIKKYEKCTTKEEGELVGVEIAKQVIDITLAFVDGYYFTFPFNRVYLLNKILNKDN